MKKNKTLNERLEIKLSAKSKQELLKLVMDSQCVTVSEWIRTMIHEKYVENYAGKQEEK